MQTYWQSFEQIKPLIWGKYIVCRKDGKIHLETWNGTGWAYNHNEIKYWAELTNPILNL
jgi:hypothetical protein